MNKSKLYQRQNWIIKNIQATKNNIQGQKEKINPDLELIRLYNQDLRRLIDNLEYVTKLINK